MYMVLSTNLDPSSFKGINMISELPSLIKKEKFIYSDSGTAKACENLSEVIPLARRHA